MPSPRLSTGWTVGLLGVLLVGVGLFLAVLGGAVLVPQGIAALVLGAAVLVFVGVQALLFRGVGLRSKADEDAAEDDDGDWHAWKG